MRNPPVTCRYCGGKVIRCSARALYGARGQGEIYFCTNCNAAVGVNTAGEPKGKLANAVLRQKRIDTHRIFDRWWKTRGMTRSEGYVWLARQMHLPTRLAHIGNFDMDECDTVVALCMDDVKKRAGGKTKGGKENAKK